MIIELIGLPGSGKTYIANQIIDKVYNKRAINVTEWSRTTFEGRAIKKIIYLMSNVCPEIKNYKDNIYRIVGSRYPKSLFGLYDDFENCIDMFSVTLYTERKYLKKSGVYLFDEGSLHSISKLYGDFDIESDVVIRLVQYCLKVLDIKSDQIIFNHISVDDDIKSIKMRNRNACRFDRLSDEHLGKILTRYYQSCEIINNLTGAINIERNEPNDEKMLKIKRLIKSE